MHQLPNADRQRVPERPADEPDGLDGGDERLDRGTPSNTAATSRLKGLRSETNSAPTPGILSLNIYSPLVGKSF